MYSKQEASLIRKEFWTSLGLYMRPLQGADGMPVNWLNYKTGIRHFYFRMDANNKTASIAIELRQPDAETREHYFNRLQLLRSMLVEQAGEEWSWELNSLDEDGKPISRIGIEITGVNIFNKADWPAIISFLKPRMLALDNFWGQAKEMVEV
ncbi:MAG: DUF4268 domain-containing protein [Chitinophagaceae bacterium]|nr:MAG: DUF4268 domain-containing protein [Chitinophagaceae bacterium]